MKDDALPLVKVDRKQITKAELFFGVYEKWEAIVNLKIFLSWPLDSKKLYNMSENNFEETKKVTYK